MQSRVACFAGQADHDHDHDHGYMVPDMVPEPDLLRRLDLRRPENCVHANLRKLSFEKLLR